MYNKDELIGGLKQLNLSAMIQVYQSYAEQAEKSNQSHISFLQTLVNAEVEDKNNRRIQRLIKQAKLPYNKGLSDFEHRIPSITPSILEQLSQGDFIDRQENLLLFGNPGTGKSHLAIGLAKEWCLRGRRVFYTTAANMVQQLLRAKQALILDQAIKRIDRYEMLIIDDISYVPFERSETDVLFTLLSERYERRSLLITSNLVFSDWENIFKDKMTTTAAIDRLVHHATILELNAKSYRSQQAQQRKAEEIVSS